MHATTLLNEILRLRLRLSICDANEAEDLHAQIDERMENICKLSKVSKHFVRQVVNSRYRGFVAEQFHAGNLVPVVPVTSESSEESGGEEQ